MELMERLRRRSQQSKETAQVDCGGLGVLTIQALPIRECQAIANGPDGDRALLYAACRQLQSAGEQLRREGRLFRPDEIMQLVSEEEARAGAAAVRQLSGLDLRQDSGAEETPPRSQKAGQPEAETQPGRDGTPQSQRPARENGMDKIRHGFVQGTAPPTRTDQTETERIPPESVHKIGRQTSETGQRFDRHTAVGQASREAERENSGGKSRPDSASGYKIQRVQAANRPVYEENVLPKRGEKEREQGGKADKPAGIKPDAPAPERKQLHEIKSESGGSAHGRGEEYSSPERERLHETKLESSEAAREIKSEFHGQERARLNETKSEFHGRSEGRLQEIKPELRASVPATGAVEQSQGSMPAVTEDLAREVAQAILDGLQRAAGAR